MTTSEPKSWRDQIKVHPAAELFPMMTPDELKALGEDIVENGLKTNIAVWQAASGRRWFLLDGRNRLDAAEHVGLSVKFIKSGWDFTVKIGNHEWAVDDHSLLDPYEHVISANVLRRHLTSEQKRDVIAKLLKATPGTSDRQIAEMVKVDHKTVASVRTEKEATGEVSPVAKRTGKDGKARKVPTKDPAVIAMADATNDEPGGVFPIYGPCAGGRVVTERTSTRTKAKADLTEASANRSAPLDLIASFTEQLRANGLDLVRRIGPVWPTFVERLREVIDEIELEAERRAKEPQRALGDAP